MRFLHGGVLAIACSASWLTWEISQRVVAPGRYDEDRRMHEMVEADPKAGTSLPKGITSKAKNVALIWMGDCSGCSSRGIDIEAVKAAKPASAELILATGEAAEDRPEFKGLRKVQLTTEQQKSLNAFFAPRVYVFREGRLAAVQLTGQDATDLVGKAK